MNRENNVDTPPAQSVLTIMAKPFEDSQCRIEPWLCATDPDSLWLDSRMIPLYVAAVSLTLFGASILRKDASRAQLARPVSRVVVASKLARLSATAGIVALSVLTTVRDGEKYVSPQIALLAATVSRRMHANNRYCH
jgi:hypothetical protein